MQGSRWLPRVVQIPWMLVDLRKPCSVHIHLGRAKPFTFFGDRLFMDGRVSKDQPQI